MAYTSTMTALFRALDENGYRRVVLDIQDHLHGECNEYDQIEFMPFTADGTPDDEITQVIWSMLVEMFGDFGVSNRTGWIEHVEEARQTVDKAVSLSGCEFDWQDGWPLYVRTGLPVELDENNKIIEKYPVK